MYTFVCVCVCVLGVHSQITQLLVFQSMLKHTHTHIFKFLLLCLSCILPIVFISYMPFSARVYYFDFQIKRYFFFFLLWTDDVVVKSPFVIYIHIPQIILHWTFCLYFLSIVQEIFNLANWYENWSSSSSSLLSFFMPFKDQQKDAWLFHPAHTCITLNFIFSSKYKKRLCAKWTKC